MKKRRKSKCWGFICTRNSMYIFSENMNKEHEIYVWKMKMQEFMTEARRSREAGREESN